jgi:hypothetical protein
MWAEKFYALLPKLAELRKLDRKKEELVALRKQGIRSLAEKSAVDVRILRACAALSEAVTRRGPTPRTCTLPSTHFAEATLLFAPELPMPLPPPSSIHSSPAQ